MSEAEETIVFQPDKELDDRSKMGYLDHISSRLQLAEPLPCKKQSGLMSTPELRHMAEQIMRFERQIDVSEDANVEAFLNDLRLELEERVDLEFVVGRSWEKFTKSQVGTVIAATLGFQYAGDPHIGTNNGVVYIEFLRDIYERLPDPESPVPMFTEERIGESSIERGKVRQMTAKQLFELLNTDGPDGITVPEYQRSDQQWGKKKWEAMVDSMLRTIPMPSIVLGKTRERPDDPWQLVDGHQRVSTIDRFLNDEHHQHFDYQGFSGYHNLPKWARRKYDTYKFNVEWVIAKDDRELAKLYELYNSSGKPMSTVQIRVARFHEVSALHHYLLAMAGGPMLRNREMAKVRLGIAEHIESRAERAHALRALLPRTGSVTDDERLQLRLVTEKVYDLFCRVVAYSIYRDLPNNTEFPTLKGALDTVLPAYRHSSSALPIGEKLDYIIRECSSLYGDYAFKTQRIIKETEHDDGKMTFEYDHGLSVHGWATQVQCAAIWGLDDEDLSLLKHNPDTFQDAWRRSVIQNITHRKQNSKTIWDAQTKWTNKVRKLIAELKSEELEDEESPRRKRLLAAVDIALSFDGDNREKMIQVWETTLDPIEVTYMRRELEERL